MMMSVDERIRFLIQAAIRAEGEGDLRIARIFRRMADDARPLDVVLSPVVRPAFGGSSE